MKTTKIIFTLALCAGIFASCTKEEAVQTEAVKGVPMSFTASITAATKTSYEDDATAKTLKTSWAVGDKISVITLDDSNAVQTVDNFTAQAAGSSATFSGTFTGGDSPATIIVCYPAYDNGTALVGSSNTYTYTTSPSVDAVYGGANLCRFGLCQSNNASYKKFDFSYMSQFADGDPSHLKYYDYMYGTATLDGATLTGVTMSKNITVFKVTINTSAIPEGTAMKCVRLKIGSNLFGTGSWSYSYAPAQSNIGGKNNTISLYLGSNSSGGSDASSFSGITKTAGDDELVVYIPNNIQNGTSTTYAYDENNIKYFTVSVGCGESAATVYSKEAMLTKDFYMVAGKVETISATVAATD